MGHGDGHFSVSGTKIEGVGYTKQNVLVFRSTWPCVYPSFYGSEPPVSTRITVLLFLSTTGSFFVISLTDLHGSRADTLRWTFPGLSCHGWIQLPASSAGCPIQP